MITKSEESRCGALRRWWATVDDATRDLIRSSGYAQIPPPPIGSLTVMVREGVHMTGSWWPDTQPGPSHFLLSETDSRALQEMDVTEATE